LQEILNNHLQGAIYWTVEAAESPSSETVLQVINNTPEDICYLYIVPSDSESWGENWLTEIDKIPVGEKSTFSMEAGMYNLKAENCAREAIAETHDNHLQGPMEWDLK
jgi:hypothetical protein